MLIGAALQVPLPSVASGIQDINQVSSSTFDTSDLTQNSNEVMCTCLSSLLLHPNVSLYEGTPARACVT